MNHKQASGPRPKQMTPSQKSELQALLRGLGKDTIELSEAYRNHCLWEKAVVVQRRKRALRTPG